MHVRPSFFCRYILICRNLFPTHHTRSCRHDGRGHNESQHARIVHLASSVAQTDVTTMHVGGALLELLPSLTILSQVKHAYATLWLLQALQ
jgi:hypothetical protein